MPVDTQAGYDLSKVLMACSAWNCSKDTCKGVHGNHDWDCDGFSWRRTIITEDNDVSSGENLPLLYIN